MMGMKIELLQLTRNELILVLALFNYMTVAMCHFEIGEFVSAEEELKTKNALFVINLVLTIHVTLHNTWCNPSCALLRILADLYTHLGRRSLNL